MAWHMADIWEAVARGVPDAPALIEGDKRYSWAEYDQRAARLAQVLVDHGLEPGAKLSIYALNCAEYMESQFAAFKARLTPVNINYRYLADELVHVITNSDSEAVVFQKRYAPNMTEIRDRLPAVTLFLQIDDGTPGSGMDGALDYEQTLTGSDPMPVIERSDDDVYMLYTGGTTGLPKGVMYDHNTFAGNMAAKGYEMRQLEAPSDAADFADKAKAVRAADASVRVIPACPLMHGTGMWVGAMMAHNLGGCVILDSQPGFDADRLWRLAEKEAATDIVIVGDVFARPMVDALERARDEGRPYDLSAMRMMGSSGVMWSTEVKRALLDHLPIVIVDSMGSTEGSMGASVTMRETLETDRTAKFDVIETTKVLKEDGTPVAPGSGETGLICNGGMVPLGYYKDAKKTAETFRTINGTRYSIPGDHATVEADGSITLLGRGSQCINSGGEKIFPEEVEEAVKTHADVVDCLVVGMPDERFGQKVAAVLSLRPGATFDKDGLDAHARNSLAAYKVPREYLIVDEVPRAANGKAGYKAATELARAAA